MTYLLLSRVGMRGNKTKTLGKNSLVLSTLTNVCSGLTMIHDTLCNDLRKAQATLGTIIQKD